jgi:hypothetical protein
VQFNKDFDQFFKNLLDAIITESGKGVADSGKSGDDDQNEAFLRELMDNCIYVTHQLFELSEINKDLSKFMVTGFLFNSIVLNLPSRDPGKKDSGKTVLH